ncbi:hypothetical protein DID88_005464 [Monilinia fructigena]|uniref:Peptidase A1 domain-containing protein n=1 Tax=Monilinia fructigena TaxID=38457 RepID=A0A395J571_9HELO|nr:hypothetical protein DID88_005464 [Monilinia fructigena]
MGLAPPTPQAQPQSQPPRAKPHHRLPSLHVLQPSLPQRPIASNRTGTLLLGSLPPADSYTGELVPVPLVVSKDLSGYYIAQPVVSHANTSIPSDSSPTTCLIDSGSLELTLPFGDNSTDFLARTGLENYDYDIMYPSDCEDIPADLTLDFEIASASSKTETKTIKIKVPYRNLARGSEGPARRNTRGKMRLERFVGDSCVFGAPWFLGTSLGVDDGEGLVWIAQGRL